MMAENDAMSTAPVILSLPISDRRRAFAFYREVLALEAIGEVADDGLPDPLQFADLDGHLWMVTSASVPS